MAKAPKKRKRHIESYAHPGKERANKLHESGSCFVQIGKENVHRAGVVMDEIFGAGNRSVVRLS